MNSRLIPLFIFTTLLTSCAEKESQEAFELKNQILALQDQLIAMKKKHAETEEKLIERDKRIKELEAEDNFSVGPLNIPSVPTEEKYYDMDSLITNLGGPVKSRYINLNLKLEGLAGDFEKILEINEHRLRDEALRLMGDYTYEDAQLDGFQERVRTDLKKVFASVLSKYRDGESDLIRQVYFTQFVVQ